MTSVGLTHLNQRLYLIERKILISLLVKQDRLTGRLSGLYEEGKGLRDTLRLTLVAVNRINFQE